VGLNSGQVIAGEIGSGAFGDTAIGEQVGHGRDGVGRPARGGVTLSVSTARLVDGAAALGEPEAVLIKVPPSQRRPNGSLCMEARWVAAACRGSAVVVAHVDGRVAAQRIAPFMRFAVVSLFSVVR
jgi:hypothetical protein